MLLLPLLLALLLNCVMLLACCADGVRYCAYLHFHYVQQHSMRYIRFQWHLLLLAAADSAAASGVPSGTCC
jgi:hypothetical protein